MQKAGFRVLFNFRSKRVQVYRKVGGEIHRTLARTSHSLQGWCGALPCWIPAHAGASKATATTAPAMHTERLHFLFCASVLCPAQNSWPLLLKALCTLLGTTHPDILEATPSSPRPSMTSVAHLPSHRICCCRNLNPNHPMRVSTLPPELPGKKWPLSKGC